MLPLSVIRKFRGQTVKTPISYSSRHLPPLPHPLLCSPRYDGAGGSSWHGRRITRRTEEKKEKRRSVTRTVAGRSANGVGVRREQCRRRQVNDAAIKMRARAHTPGPPQHGARPTARRPVLYHVFSFLFFVPPPLIIVTGFPFIYFFFYPTKRTLYVF